MLEMHDFRLRPMNTGDIDRVRQWRNLEHVKAYMFTDDDITEDEHKSWFDQTLLSDDADYQIVEYQEKPIGLANAIKINNISRSCSWGFYIAETGCQKGCGTMLSCLMLSHIFNTYPVHTIYAEVFEFNSTSLKLHEKFGFKPILELARTTIKSGKNENVIALSLSRDDWETTKPTILKTLNP